MKKYILISMLFLILSGCSNESANNNPVLEEETIEEVKISGVIEKGETIEIEGYSYLILNVNDNLIEVMDLNKIDQRWLEEEDNTFVLDSDTSINPIQYACYSNSSIDKFLNEDVEDSYYFELPECIKKAIVEKDIKQSVYEFRLIRDLSELDNAKIVAWTEYPDYDEEAQDQRWISLNFEYIKQGEVEVGPRKIYILDMDDILSYIGNSITPNDLLSLFPNQESNDRITVCLRSASYGFDGCVMEAELNWYGNSNMSYINGIGLGNTLNIYPVYTLDTDLLVHNK